MDTKFILLQVAERGWIEQVVSMSSMIESLLQHTGDFENTGLVGDSANLVLKRLYKALAISNLWIWCEPPIGTFCGASAEELSLAIAAELEPILTLVPGCLESAFTTAEGSVESRLKEMLETAWQPRPTGASGVVFCLNQTQLLAAQEGNEPSAKVVLEAFQSVQQRDLPFFLAVVSDEDGIAELNSQVPSFFQKTLRC